MSAREDPDPVEAVRTDIEATRADLAETVNELSDRLNPKKRVGAATQGLTDSTGQVVQNAQGLTRTAGAKMDQAAKAGARHARRLANGRERQVVGGLVLVGGLILGWRLWRHRR
jgi:Protein of unknown function (DUF3618)